MDKYEIFNMPKWYDTKEGIEECVKDMELFKILRKKRREIYKEKEDNNILQVWIIFGKYRIDEFGQTMAVSFGKKTYENEQNILNYDIPPVIDEYIFKTEYVRTYAYGSPCHIPEPYSICPETGRSWTVENSFDNEMRTYDRERVVNLKDYVGKKFEEVLKYYERKSLKEGVTYRVDTYGIRNDKYIDLTLVEGYEDLKVNERGWYSPKYPDKTCQQVNHSGDIDAIGTEYIVEEGDEIIVEKIVFYTKSGYLSKITKETILEFEEAFLKAGFPPVKFGLRRNEYWGQDDITGPWVDTYTDIGKIRVGWRKRVVEVKFSDETEIYIPEIIEDDVSKGDRLFHAWSIDKLAEYLKLCREHLLNKVKEKV